MEAVRPKVDPESPRELFDGLSLALPPAPTERPEVAVQQQTIQEEARDEVMDEGLLVPIAPAASTEGEAQSGSMNFRNLYGNVLEEDDLAGQTQSTRYPDLPSPRRMDNTVMVPQYAIGGAVQSPVKEDGDSSRVLIDNEIEASAPVFVADAPNPATSQYNPYQLQQPQQPIQQQSQTDSIIAQLVSENSRLNDEVQRLLQLVQASYNQQEPPQNQQVPQRPTQLQQQQQQQEQQEQQEQPQPLQSPTVQANVQSGETTATDQTQQKYVCCGNCRQWLQAPRGAMMVHCPNCGCVNNCEMAHRRLEAQQQQHGGYSTLAPPHVRHLQPPQQQPLGQQQQLQQQQQSQQWQHMPYGGRPRRGMSGPLAYIPQMLHDCFAAFEDARDRLLEEPSSSSSSAYMEFSGHGAPAAAATAPVMHQESIHGTGYPRANVEMQPMVADAGTAQFSPSPPPRPENAIIHNSTLTSQNSTGRPDFY